MHSCLYPTRAYLAHCRSRPQRWIQQAPPPRPPHSGVVPPVHDEECSHEDHLDDVLCLVQIAAA